MRIFMFRKKFYSYLENSKLLKNYYKIILVILRKSKIILSKFWVDWCTISYIFIKNKYLF